MTEVQNLLTPTEIAAPTYYEWSDATLAMAVRALADDLQDREGSAAMAHVAAAALLVSLATDAKAKKITTDFEGDWVVTVEKVK